jgi:hypothetical protein
LIDKSRLQGEAFSYAGSGLVWKARLFLFLGFALIAGGFAGSCVGFLYAIFQCLVGTNNFVLVCLNYQVHCSFGF